MSSTHPDEAAQVTARIAPPRSGQVIPVGGAEELDPTASQSILAEFLRLSGGKRAHLAIIPTASGDPAASGEGYCQLFKEMGAQAAEVLEIGQREDANQAAAVELIERATGVFITGGDQARLVSLLVGTLVMEAIRRCNRNGVVVAGTSAGASILSAHMLVPGANPDLRTNDAGPRRGEIEIVIIDQHFSQRGRIGRLLAAFAANPGLLGLGIDEDTAAIIDGSSVLTVMGSGAVTVIDGRNATSDYFQRTPGEMLSIVDSHIFVLGPGRQFDLTTRRPMSLADA